MTTDVATFASSEFTMRYKQPYTTEGLNKKFAGIQPRGCYRGFRLGVDGGAGDRTLAIVGDATFSDHLAVYETATGFSLTLRKTGGNFLIALTAYASQTVYVTIYATYAVGATTAAFIRVYTEAEFAAAAEKDELVVLGKADVPAAGNPITAAMIHGDERDMAWQNHAPEDLHWIQLNRNPNFAWGEDGGTYESAAAYWRLYSDNPSTNKVGVDTADPDEGFNHVTLLYGAGAANWSISQTQMLPVTPGQRIRIRLRKKSVQAATAGTGNFLPVWLDDVGNGVVGTLIPFDISSVDANYVTIDTTIQVPSGLNITTLGALALVVDSATFGAAASAIYVGSFRIWLEMIDPEDDSVARSVKGREFVESLTLFPSDSDFSDLDNIPKLYGVVGEARLVRNDERQGSSFTPVNLKLVGQLLNLGEDLLNSTAQTILTRVQTPWASTLASKYTLLHLGNDISSVTGGARIYLISDSTGPGYAVVTNAVWNGTSTWSQEDGSKPSTMLRIQQDGLKHYDVAAGAGTWADNAWLGPQVSLNQSFSDFLNRTVRYGNDLLSTSPSLRVPRIRIDRGDTTVEVYARTLIAQFDHPGGAFDQTVRIYRGFTPLSGDGLLFAYNCYWDGTNWNCDKTAIGEVLMLAISATAGLVMWTKYLSLGTPWGDGGWDKYDQWDTTAGGGIQVWDKQYEITNTTGSISNPTYTVGGANKIIAKNIVKGWGFLLCDGSGGFTSRDGFNHASASFATGEITVNLTTAMDDTNYAVVLGFDDAQRLASNGWVIVYAKTTTSFKLAYITSASPVGSKGSLDVVGQEVHYVIMGKQTT